MEDVKQENTGNPLVKEGIQRILKFTNAVTEEDLVIEKCEVYRSDLAGYSIVLPRAKFTDMLFLVTKVYKDYEATFKNIFDNGTDEQIIQMCRIFARGMTYTEQLVRLNGGIENLICDTDLGEGDLMEEEDPEMIAELEQKVAELEKQLKEKEKEHVEKVSTVESELKDYKKYFEGLDFNDDDLGLCLDVLEGLNKDQLLEVVTTMLVSRAGEEDNKDFKVLSLYVNDMAESLDSLGLLGV